jgi:O-antigen/teichoic acid export membrane protein
LALFGEGYEAGYPILIILGVGLLFDAATGPARTTMMMTGYERSFVLLFGTATLAGMLVTVAVVPFFGLIGAATANAVARAVSRIAISVWCVKRTGVDPTIFGVLRVNSDAAGGQR